MEQLSGVISGYEPFILENLFKNEQDILYIVPNEVEMDKIIKLMKTVYPNVDILSFPNWDTVPFDRISPQPERTATRIDTLIQLLSKSPKKRLIVATASAVLQRVPLPDFFKESVFSFKEGDTVFQSLQNYLIKNGYSKTGTVLEVGEYAVRGGIIDLFPAGYDVPIRVDFFGDEVDSIKLFDAVTQRTTGILKQVVLKPIREFKLTDEIITNFRTKYRALCDDFDADDALYRAVSEGRYIQGIEQYMPFLHREMGSLFDYIGEQTRVILASNTHKALTLRFEQINDFYDARKEALNTPNNLEKRYYPVPVDSFYLSPDDIIQKAEVHRLLELTPYKLPDTKVASVQVGADFTSTRLKTDKDVFETVTDFIRGEKCPVVISAVSDGSAERLFALFKDRGLILHRTEQWKDVFKKTPSIIVAPFEKGFRTPRFLIITETDILGERIVRSHVRRPKVNLIGSIDNLQVGDIVVHQTHGVAQFDGLESLSVGGVRHDCLRLIYADNDKLFLPVENIDMLSKYGSANPVLDKLGSVSFINRKERVKKDLFIMVEALMKVAAARELTNTPRILAPHGSYQEFCAAFPYTETDDQLQAIAEIESDLASGRPMDRLVCGDVGFGKTEVAMRSAYLSAINGGQVAVIVPTTLLARQHTLNFRERFKNTPIRIGSLSRLVSAAGAKSVLKELEEGKIDIIIGTHALLSNRVKFKNLNMVIVDEEQHFGVTHKERLKELKKGVHVLTLTATPIPRTLQLSLSGVRELSIIATPPVDRLAVKTYVMPFDSLVIKEALLREHFRGGQSFYVCPRIKDMDEVRETLSKIVPDLKVVMAHGQMAAGQLEKIMMDFSDKKYDILLATSIIESGLDISSVNTMIVHRADMFGLSALYQLRGRVGRGKLRAYAYLTTYPNGFLNENAQKRLIVMQGLDSLGVGFQLASHDLDIRGAGNLLGKEQSGHIREVGVSLYQKMLADAVRRLREKSHQENPIEDNADLMPQISLGIPVYIPENYVGDLSLRLQLYAEMADLQSSADIENKRIEFLDRFGPYPVEVDNLFKVIELKLLAKRANIEKIEVGPKGASLSFYENTFKNPAGLVNYISAQMGTMKIKPDQKLLVLRPMTSPADKLETIKKIISKIAEIAEE